MLSDNIIEAYRIYMLTNMGHTSLYNVLIYLEHRFTDLKFQYYAGIKSYIRAFDEDSNDMWFLFDSKNPYNLRLM